MGGYGVSDDVFGGSFDRVVTTDLVEQVAVQLHRAIVDGHLKPGDRVVEAALSRQMSVSRAPIREAARILAERGLLEQIPRRGFFVRTFCVRDLEELVELRACIELAALNLCLEQRSLRIAEILERAVEGAARDKAATESALDMELAIHGALVDAAGNQRFSNVFRDVADEVRVIASLHLKKLRYAFQADDYVPLIRGLRTRDLSRSTSALRTLLDGCHGRLFQAMGGRGHDPSRSPEILKSA